MKRSGFGHFGGLHVFPGGKVDSIDEAARWQSLTTGPNDAEASQTLGLTMGGLAYWIACIRECFEEAGVLLARNHDDQLLPLNNPVRRKRFEDWRSRLNESEPGALELMCTQEFLRLATDHLAYLSHWITPLGQPARFDTRFFVARAPSEQEALHDGHETVDSEWIRPEVALDRFREGQLNLISPTSSNLEAIAGYNSAAEILAAKRAVDPATIPTIRPRLGDGGQRPDGSFDEVLEVIGYGGESEPADANSTD